MGLESLNGKTVDDLFKGAPKIVAPFPSAARNKKFKDYDEQSVGDAIRSGATSKVDPTTLHGTQPWITEAGVRHYAEGRAGTFADGHQLGNAHPVVYHREEPSGGITSMLLSGHHRATTALLKGEHLDAIEARGGYGGPR